MKWGKWKWDELQNAELINQEKYGARDGENHRGKGCIYTSSSGVELYYLGIYINNLLLKSSLGCLNFSAWIMKICNSLEIALFNFKFG